MKTPSVKALLIIAAVLQIVWGLVPSASSVIIKQIPVEIYIAIRWTISGVIFWVWLAFYGRTPNLNLRRILPIVVLGILGYGLASLGTLYGLKIGGVTNFALIGALSPVITSLVAITILNEKPTKLFYFALPLCVFGLLFLVLGKHQISSWQIALSSSALIIAAAFLEALVFVFSKRYKSTFGTVPYLMITQLSAAAFMWALQFKFFNQFSSLQNLNLKGTIAILFVSIIACVLCYAILYWLLDHLHGHRLALFDGLHTISATFFGYILFQEVFNIEMFMGACLLLSGLVVGNWPSENPSSTIQS